MRHGASVSLIALLAAMPAAAQDSTEKPAAHSSPIEQIVVTAQSRAQALQKVPISINAFSSDFIKQKGAQNLADLQKYTPGLEVDGTSTTQPTYTIRGVSGASFGIGTDPAVGLYLDGVYSARSGEALVFLDDVARVEVLKGPQGTLFGRNTAAGAISIISNKPEFKYTGSLDYKVGNYGKQEGTLMLNVPISDKFAVRVNAIINRRDGFITNQYNGEKLNDEHNESVRVAARYKPSADTDILFAWDHDNTNVTPPTALGIGPYSLNGGNPLGPVYDRVINGQESRRLDDLTLTVRQLFGDYSLTSISAYKFFSTQNRESETGSPLAARYFDTENVENNHNFYQELKFAGTWNNVNFIAGASYYQERAKQQSIATALTDSIQTLAVGAEGIPVISIVDSLTKSDIFGLPWQETMNNLGQNRAYSAFGDAIWSVTPKIDLTAGLRFTDDQKKFQWQAPPVLIPGAPQSALNLLREFVGNIVFPTAPVPQGQAFARSNGWTNASPRFVAAYHWTDDVMTYASASYGYKAGGYNATEVNSHYEPEYVSSYELGLKSDWLDHRLRVNLAGYYYEYTNQQSITLEPVPNALAPEYLVQVGNSQGKGVDLEVVAAPIDGLTLSVVTGYLESTWTKRIEYGLNLAGQATGEPDLRVVTSIDYHKDLGELGHLRFNATHSFTSRDQHNAADAYQEAAIRSYVNFKLLPGYFQSRNLTDLRASWSDRREHYTVALYAQNLFDHRYVSRINYITAANLQTPYVRPELPRLWGAELTYRF